MAKNAKFKIVWSRENIEGYNNLLLVSQEDAKVKVFSHTKGPFK